MKNITFLYVFGAIRWSHRLGMRGGMGGWGGLGLTDCVIAVVLEFPAPCGVTPVAVGSGDPGAAFN